MKGDGSSGVLFSKLMSTGHYIVKIAINNSVRSILQIGRAVDTVCSLLSQTLAHRQLDAQGGDPASFIHRCLSLFQALGYNKDQTSLCLLELPF